MKTIPLIVLLLFALVAALILTGHWVQITIEARRERALFRQEVDAFRRRIAEIEREHARARTNSQT